EWKTLRRKHLVTAVEMIYGTMPPKPQHVTTKVLARREILGGTAVETLLVMLIHRGESMVPVRVGVVRPKNDRPCGVVIKNDRWLFDLSAMPPGRKRDQYESQDREATFRAVRKMTMDRGVAICKFVREDLAVDAPNCRQTGVLAMYPEESWGTIAAWAWAYSPLIDLLQRDFGIDPKRIISTGHSRGGKTALAAAIFDERIAVAAPSASGSGGTGSMQYFTEGGRRQTSETLFANHSFWFAPGLASLDSSKVLPVDGHVLQALVAPRGLINTQGIDDGLANPRGTKMMFERSREVFKLLGAKLPPATHWRPGGHGHTLEDWKAVLDYADAYYGGQPLPDGFDDWPATAGDDAPHPQPLSPENSRES
ncbi:MAG: hypothetical protein AAFP69_09980, partial [Planctomycetota bacterium]